MKKYILVLVILISITNSAFALEFLQLGGTFSMHGEIKQDDSIKLLLELATWENPPTVFVQTSAGGNIDEAMKIGDIVGESQIPAGQEKNVIARVFLFMLLVLKDMLEGK